MSTLGELLNLRFIYRDRELSDEQQDEIDQEYWEHKQEIENDDKAGGQA